MDRQMWQQIVELALEQGLIARPVDLNELFTAQFIQ
jgi:hypothetical protein